MKVLEQIRDRVHHIGDKPCIDVVELVTDYLEDAMTPKTRKRFERHLNHCSACSIYVEQVRRTADALGHVHPDPPRGRTRDALLQAFRDFERN